MLLWSRPYERRSGNVINIFIQVVRALSVVCILVFVEELGIAQTTQTITGIVLIAVQSALTGVLGILIAVNAIIMCCKENPHRKRRKEAGRLPRGFDASTEVKANAKIEKLNRDLDVLTPLDARNSLLMDPTKMQMNSYFANDPKYPLAKQSSGESFMNQPANPYSGATPLRPYTPQSAQRSMRSVESRENLVRGAAPLGGSPPREPRIPNLPGYGGYRGVAY